MTDIFNIVSLPEKLLQKIVVCFYIRTLARFRQTCHFADNFVERRRYEISKSRIDFFTLNVRVSKNKFKFFYGGTTIPQPLTQLSAMNVGEICFEFADESPLEHEEIEKLKKILVAMRKTYGQVRIFGNREPSEGEMYLLSAANSKNMCLNLHGAKVPFARLFLHPTFKNVSSLYSLNHVWDEFPADKFVDSIRHSKNVYIQFVNEQQMMAVETGRHIVKEIMSKPDIEMFPCATLQMTGIPVNIMSHLPKMQLVWRNSTDQRASFKYIYALPLPSKILVLAISEYIFEDTRRYCQAMSFDLIEKSRSALIDTIQKCTDNNRVCDVPPHYVFERVVGDLKL